MVVAAALMALVVGVIMTRQLVWSDHDTGSTRGGVPHVKLAGEEIGHLLTLLHRVVGDVEAVTDVELYEDRHLPRAARHVECPAQGPQRNSIRKRATAELGQVRRLAYLVRE